ncbi:MAG: hypothetical protein ACI9N1_001072 [Flavobacteriales bacterium]|jgi:hypothetical protein
MIPKEVFEWNGNRLKQGHLILAKVERLLFAVVPYTEEHANLLKGLELWDEDFPLYKIICHSEGQLQSLNSNLPEVFWDLLDNTDKCSIFNLQPENQDLKAIENEEEFVAFTLLKDKSIKSLVQRSKYPCMLMPFNFCSNQLNIDRGDFAKEFIVSLPPEILEESIIQLGKKSEITVVRK